MSRLRGLASHPLFIAIVAAGVGFFLTGYIAQRIARDWRHDDQRFDLRVDLSLDVTAAAGGFFAAVETSALDPAAKRRVALDEAWTDWVTRSDAIAARLEAYFGRSDAGDDVAGRWRVFDAQVARLYDVFRAQRVRDRPRVFALIRRYVGAKEQDVNGLLDSAVDVRGEPNPTYLAALRHLLLRFRDREAGFVSEILGSPMRI
jgi:hypothetical protein